MANETSQTSRSSSSSVPSSSLRPLWQRELFDNDASVAFDRVRNATNSSYVVFASTSPGSLNADITTIHHAITLNEDTIAHLAQKQEDLKEESRLELNMKESLELEAKRLEESIAIHRREIKNIGIREEIRQYELAELKDLGLVMIVQALRQETPEEWRTERGIGNEMPGHQRSESRSQGS